ncbi:Transmembrane protein [Entamoeba marina]
MVRRRHHVPKDEDFDNKSSTTTSPQSNRKTITWMVLGSTLIPIAFFVPTLLASIGDYVSDHIELFYGLWIVYAITLLGLKMFYLKNHNWDSFLTVLTIAAIVAMGSYRLLGFEKHFPIHLKRIGFYMWLAVCMIPTIIFYLIDDTDYFKLLEKEQEIQKNEEKLRKKVHEKHVKEREKNPPFWMKTKARKVACDTIVYICFILLIIIIVYVLYWKYVEFSYRVKRGLDVNDYGDYYGYEGYVGEEFNPTDFIHEDDLL